MNLLAVLILAFGFYVGCDNIGEAIKDLARSIRDRRS